MTTKFDITHCSGDANGTLCPIRDLCRRHDYFKRNENKCGVKNYGANTSFMTAPYDHKRGDCIMFWGNAQDGILNQLKDIMGIKNKKRKKIGYKLKKK